MTGFEKYMQNPYWKEYYQNAPSEALKEYIKLGFENSPFVTDNPDPDYKEKRKELSNKFTNEDWQYLIDNTSSGQAKAEYRKHLI